MSNENLGEIDLNFPLVEETSTSTNRQGGSFGSPIVVEERENDVQVLSSLESSSQRGDQSSGNDQVAAELGAMVEPPLGQSVLIAGVGAEELVATLLSTSLGDTDLNFPLVEETSTSTNRPGGLFGLPIVVEESENDVQVLSLLESSSQRGDQSSGNDQVAAELGAMVEPPLGQSGVGAEEHVATLLSTSLGDTDLNFPLVEETSTSTNRQGGLFGLPIVVEESENDVQVLSLLESSSQRGDQSSGNDQVAAELGAMVEPPLGQSGVGAEEHVATLLSTRVSAEEPMPTLILFSILSNKERTSEYSNNTNREWNLTSGVPPSENATTSTRKEPTFRCPLCHNSLKSPVSTRCGHIFCRCCLTAALYHKKECPMCRTKLKKKKFHPIYLPDADWN